MQHLVKVYPVSKGLFGMVKAKVGWASVLPVTSDDARLFAKALLEAADEVDRQNAEIKEESK